MAMRSLLNVVLGASAISVADSLGCLNDQGEDVDFWYAFKFPHEWDYAYMDKANKLERSSPKMDATGSCVMRTLMQIYGTKNRQNLSFAMWNDEHDDGVQRAAPHAHAKGVFAFDGETGFWLTHSVPSFPSHNSSVGDPFETAKDPKYGQTFLCINIDKDGVDVLSDTLATNWVSVFESQDNAGIGDAFTKWATVNGRGKIKDPPTLYKPIHSRGKTLFHIFAKSGYYVHRLYAELVAPTLKKNLLVSSWQNGHKEDSFCNGTYTVENVEVMTMPGYDDGHWKTTQDHSKWVVTTDGSVFCVGDINRQDSQLKRGGGTTCIQNKAIAGQILALVVQKEACKSTQQKLLVV